MSEEMKMMNHMMRKAEKDIECANENLQVAIKDGNYSSITHYSDKITKASNIIVTIKEEMEIYL